MTSSVCGYEVTCVIYQTLHNVANAIKPRTQLDYIFILVSVSVYQATNSVISQLSSMKNFFLLRDDDGRKLRIHLVIVAFI